MPKVDATASPIPGSRGQSHGVDPSFDALCAAYPGHTALTADEIYSLPMELIAAIQQEAPKLFSPTDLKFERHLARLADHGFFLRRPFGVPAFLRRELLAKAHSTAQQSQMPADAEDLAHRSESSQSEIRTMISELMNSDGRKAEEIDQYFQRPAEFESYVRTRLLGYAGWLVTNATFRRERDEFCTTWESKIRQDGDLPTVPISLMGESHPIRGKKERRFFSEYMTFYKRWGLESLETWELPVPMKAEFLGRCFYDLKAIGEAGITMFLPFYLLRDRKLSVYDVADHKRLLAQTAHLDGWLQQQRTDWGSDRYAVMYELYRYLELALRRRYGQDLGGNIGSFDRAFARFKALNTSRPSSIDFGVDAIKKTRLKMQRLLAETVQLETPDHR